MAKVHWSASAAKQLVKIDSRYRKPIKDKVEELTAFPMTRNLDLKKLSGTKGRKYRLRMGDYRVIFEVMDGMLVVINITQIMRRQSKSY